MLTNWIAIVLVLIMHLVLSLVGWWCWWRRWRHGGITVIVLGVVMVRSRRRRSSGSRSCSSSSSSSSTTHARGRTGVFHAFRSQFARQERGFGGVGGGGGRIITFMSLFLAIMPKTLVFTAFLLLAQHCAQGCGARHVVTSMHVQHTAQGCGAKQVVTRIYVFGEHAQKTGIYSVFASLYSILCT